MILAATVTVEISLSVTSACLPGSMRTIDKSQRQSRMILINVRLSGLKQKFFNLFLFLPCQLYAGEGDRFQVCHEVVCNFAQKT